MIFIRCSNGTRGGALVGVVQALAWRGEWWTASTSLPTLYNSSLETRLNLHRILSKCGLLLEVNCWLWSSLNLVIDKSVGSA